MERVDNKAKCLHSCTFPLHCLLESPGARGANYSSRSTVLQNGVEQQFIEKKEVVGYSKRSVRTIRIELSTGGDHRWDGGTTGGQCWLCGSASSDLHEHIVSPPAICSEGIKTSGGWGQSPQVKASGNVLGNCWRAAALSGSEMH